MTPNKEKYFSIVRLKIVICIYVWLYMNLYFMDNTYTSLEPEKKLCDKKDQYKPQTVTRKY